MLHWALKPSFMTYIRNANGTVETLTPTTHANGIFSFPVSMLRGERYSAEGGISFSAHGGMLGITLIGLAIVASGNEARLLCGIDGHEEILARGSFEATSRGYKFVPRLSYLGSRTFGDVYPVGTEIGEIMLEQKPDAEP